MVGNVCGTYMPETASLDHSQAFTSEPKSINTNKEIIFNNGNCMTFILFLLPNLA